MSKRFLPALAACAVIASVFVSSAAASHSWGGYHWARTANPFTLKLGDNVSAAWDGYLATTSSDWTQSTVLDTTVVAGSAGNRKCTPPAGRVEVCNGTYGNNGWLGQAQIWLASGTTHITQGNTRVNDSYFNTATYNTPAWRNHVMCQEVGHDFGLDHQSTSGASLRTCMDYANDPTASQHPNQHDYDELGTIYSHTDSTTTVGAAVPSSQAQSENASPIAVERSDHIASSLITESFADGSKRVTNIIWALPTR